MEGKNLSNGVSYAYNGKRIRRITRHMAEDVVFGDMVWVRQKSRYWWPAQVIDDNIFRPSKKRSKKSANQVLVRLYGSYNCIYINPTQCLDEFENEFQQGNRSYKDIIHHSLSKEISGAQLDGPNKAENVCNGTSLSPGKGNRPKNETCVNKTETSKSMEHGNENSKKGSIRKVRVMQALGLSPPLGSPFRSKN